MSGNQEAIKFGNDWKIQVGAIENENPWKGKILFQKKEQKTPKTNQKYFEFLPIIQKISVVEMELIMETFNCSH